MQINMVVIPFKAFDVKFLDQEAFTSQFVSVSTMSQLLDLSSPALFPYTAPEDDGVVSEVRRLMQKVSEMKEQRKALLEQFRGQIHGDDITSVLLTQDKTSKEVSGRSCQWDQSTKRAVVETIVLVCSSV